MRTSRSGFTLVEMSIVLVIVGLIVGGVMMGQNLVRVAQVSGVLSDAKLYASSMYIFREKYGQIPGDFANAVATLGSTTVNGNGNGVLSVPAAVSATGENFQLWNQLALAGMIKGSYTGLAGPGTVNDALPGINTPVGPLKGTTYWYYSWSIQPDSGTFYGGDYDNAMVFGVDIADVWNHRPALTGKEAYGIDSKADDGYPAFGTIRTLANTWATSANGTPCASSDTPGAATYIRTGSTPNCFLVFMNTFMAPK